ncbi:hypothetical protein ACIQKB_36790 [Streptomyces sp. NPDC092046]|uniref:hypothetical protein n=1 Tax=Streptomyces sp. NPDC092046 TaxID=3366009 RepID=UPI003828140E
MPESGSTWQRAFTAQPVEALPLRTWIRERATDPDAPAVANELFIAVAAHAPVVEMTLSTAGLRVRISATGAADRAPVLTAVGQSIVAGLADQFGITPDHRGLWALLSTS